MPTPSTALTGHDCTRREIRDTDQILLDRELRDRLESRLERHGECLIYPDRAIAVTPNPRPRDGKHYSASPPRVAWALAHPEDHLAADEFPVHTCENTVDADSRRVCCNPTHLVKGTWDDVQLARKARARGFLAR